MNKILKKMALLLDARQKRQMAGIIVLMLIGGVLETLGITLIVPVMTVVVDPEEVQRNAVLSWLYGTFRMNDATQLAALIMVTLILVFIVKNIFLFILTRVQLRFVYTNQFATSRRMMIGFMMRPYEYYLNADTSVIQRSITSDVNNMYGLILSCLQLTSEIIVFVCLVGVLLVQDAQMTLFIAGLLVVVLLITKFVIKPVMIQAGKDNQDYYSGLFKWIEESVLGIKEIKIAGREAFFINGYADCGAGYVSAVQRYNLYNSTPRLLIETVAIGGMVGYMLFVMARGASLTNLLPQLSVLAAAAARLLPSANRINNYLTSIAYFEPFFMNVSDHLQEEIHDGTISYDAADYRRKRPVDKLPVTDRIELKDITYRYPNSSSYVLQHAQMTIPVGASVGIVGTTGSGKTTIVDVMLGLLTIETGQILADGVEVREHYREWLKNIGYIPQSIFLLDTTIRDNVAFGVPAEEINEAQVWQALEEAQLADFVRGLPDGLDTTVGERGIRLSGGQRQRIGIARALYEDPEVLVMDEATSALDGETEAAVMESINHLHGRKTLVIIAHRLQTIENCDIVYRIRDGLAERERG
ncbi:MAG: ABC transporter ATP-binding protein [Butyrivibrio sp.]|nr:ABC transporter ATP-binding protein [Butyrivibrio sp.]